MLACPRVAVFEYPSTSSNGVHVFADIKMPSPEEGGSPSPCTGTSLWFVPDIVVFIVSHYVCYKFAYQCQQITAGNIQWLCCQCKKCSWNPFVYIVDAVNMFILWGSTTLILVTRCVFDKSMVWHTFLLLYKSQRPLHLKTSSLTTQYVLILFYSSSWLWGNKSILRNIFWCTCSCSFIFFISICFECLDGKILKVPTQCNLKIHMEILTCSACLWYEWYIWMVQ